MEEIKTISREQKQQDYLDVIRSIIGIRFWLPEKFVKSIFLMKEGGHMYVYNASVIGIPNCIQKIEIHENKYGELLVQLVNNKLEKPVLWHKYFNNIDDFKNRIGVVKDFITTLRTS